MNKLHSYLSSKLKYYQNWHNYDYHPHTHWTALAVFVFMIGFFSINHIKIVEVESFFVVKHAFASGIPISSPVSFWKLDEVSGSRADSVGSNNLFDNGNSGQILGKINSAVHFSSSGTQYLSIADNPSLSTGDVDFTIAAWVKADDVSLSRVIASKRNSTTTSEWLLVYDANIKNFKFSTYNGNTTVGNVAASSVTPISTNTWYYVVAWRDRVAKTVNIQVNNGPVYSAVETGAPSDSTADFKIGYTYYYTTAWSGDIDEVGFWKRVLTTNQRTAMYNSIN